MCTSHVAGNTQWLVSMGKLHKSKAMWVLMQLQGMTKMSSRLPSLAMMRGGVADVDPFLDSRNTLGNGKTANSKSQRQMSNGRSGKRWRFALGNAEVVVVVDEEAIVHK